MTASNVIDLHREVSLSLLKSGVGYAVRTPRGQKDPGHLGMQGGWDPSANSPEKSRLNIEALERNNDNLGVHLFGAFVDVDVDTDSPFMVPALDFFLPPTAHIWGRKSRPRTHRLYGVSLPGVDPASTFDPSAYPFLRTLSKHEGLSVEIRGGEARSGQYSLLPGSLHPSGEAYEWVDPAAAKATPATVDLLRVVNGVRFACAVAAIAPYWTEGNRNSLCMALSGFMHRAAAHCQDLNTAYGLEFGKKQAEDLLRGLMHVAGDDETDYNMRLKTFTTTWEKADAGHPVQGATSIQKLTGNDEIVSVLYALLTDSPDLVELDEFMARYAVRNNTSNIIDLAKVGAQNVQFVMTVTDFHNSHMHRTITNGSTGERRKMTGILMSSSRAIRVDGLAFVPGAGEMVDKDGGLFVNQWRGFDVAPAVSATDEDAKLFVDYVHKIVANGSEEAAKWVLDWCAQMFQEPGRKPGTALVLVGKPGSGKTFLFEKVLRKIIGRNHSLSTNNVETLLGNFNIDSSAKILVCCNEALNSRRRADANKLKSMITDETRRVEPKNINAFEVEDHTRYGFTSNEETDAVAILDGDSDRRYTVLKVCEDYAYKSNVPDKVKAEYWDALHQWTEDRENLAKLHRWFLDRTVDFRSVRVPHVTDAKRIIAQHSQRGFDDWLMHIVNYEHPLENMRESDQKSAESYVSVKGILKPTLSEWPDFISYRRLEDSYEYYRKRKGVSASTPSYNAQQIKSEFYKRGILKTEDTKRIKHQYETWERGEQKIEEKYIRVTTMPKREYIAAYLEEHLGFKADAQDAEVIEGNKTDATELPDF